MKKSFISCFSAAMFALAACSSAFADSTKSSKGDDSVTDLKSLSSVDFARKLRAGWNLGNTLDAYGKGHMGLESESCWGMPLTTKEMIAEVKKAGFSTIRIPVSWHNHVDSDFKIDGKWLSRTKEIVDWALEEDLFVIINIHHDNLTEDDFRKDSAGFCLSLDPQLQSKSIKYINAIWTQLSDFYKDYDYRLIFELLNEPRQIGTAIEWSFTDPSKSKVWNDIITDYEQQALDIIRKSGGNNADRFIMCPEYAASPHYLNYYSLPSDSAKDKLILSTHAYDPYEFCMHLGKNNKFDQQVEASITWLFKMLSEKYTSKGTGVVMGEASASDKKNTNDRIKWAECYFSKAKAAKIPVILWDNNVTVENGGDINSGECHGYFNRRDLSWYFPKINEAVLKSWSD